MKIYINMQDKIRKPMYRIFGAAVLLIALSAGFFFLYDNRAKVLIADETKLVVVANERQVKNALRRAEDELTKEYGLPIKGFKTVLSYQDPDDEDSDEAITEDQLVSLLKSKLQWLAKGYAISVNGENILYLAQESSAQEVLEELKSRYLSEEKNQFILEDVKYQEDVQIVAADTYITDLRSVGEAVSILAQGRDKIEHYTVKKGDTLWTIARDNNVSVRELREANPQLKGDILKIGQNLDLQRYEPLINVCYTFTTTVQEKVPYDTVYENDGNLYRSEQKVKQEGAYGKREVTYKITKSNGLETERETLVEKLLSEPIKKIVTRGTKSMVVASRGGQWQGQLEWPLRGPITSGYGYRGKEFHEAIDIDGVTGDPVVSAESGTVTFAGTAGNLGKCVAIDHGDGMVTRYAHLSSIDVTSGQKVNRGRLIGKVGSTGRSTGSHLHFEVWINGEPQNPLRYLDR